MLKDAEMSASALYDGGWRSSDREELMEEYGLTFEESIQVCKMLKKYEEEK